MSGYEHCPPSIEFLLAQSPGNFKKAYPNDTEAHRSRLIELREKGYLYPPICNHTDATGKCLGHEDTE